MPIVRFAPALLFPASALLIAACAALVPPTPGPTGQVGSSASTHATDGTAKAAMPPEPVLKSARARAQFNVMAGTMAADRGQSEAAARHYLKALEVEPDSKLAEQATGLALAAGDDALALKAAQKWLDIDSSNLDARQIVARLALRTGKDDLAYRECRALIDNYPSGHADAFHLVADLLSGEQRHEDAAMSLMQRLVADYPELVQAHYAAALLALRLHHPKRAEAQAREALKLDPGAQDATMLLVAALSRQGRLQAADAAIAPLLGASKKPTDLRLGYAQILVKYGEYAHARSVLHTLLDKHPKDADARMLLGVADFQANRLDEASADFAAVKAGGPDHDAEVQYYLGRINEARHDYDAALKHYQRVDDGKLALAAAIRRAIVLGRLGKIDAARKLLDRLGSALPEAQSRLAVAESEILFNAGNPADALATISRALEQNPDDADLLYERALIQDRTGHADEAVAQLHKLLDQHPHDPRYLNGLGYMLAEHGDDQLAEAHALVSRALALTPNDPAVMDSMGWVLFRQGHADQALPLLRKAYGLLPDPEVAAHLIRVLAKLGDHDQAQALLHKVLATNPDNADLRRAANAIGR